jgi:hypothetical protein
MFQQFLQIVQQGQVSNQIEIAQKLGISPGMALQIARDLAKRGYLQSSEGDSCSTHGEACGGCPLGGSCQGLFNAWSLTEKGLKALAR